MRVAALYDIHGMLTPLQAVLDEVEDTDVIVVGGDVASGPQPSETLELLRGLGDRVSWVRGNGDRELATGGTGITRDVQRRSLDGGAALRRAAELPRLAGGDRGPGRGRAR